jgi:hypothetical protein
MIIRRMNFSRTHYFSGQLLSAEDFLAEQNYLRDTQRFRNLHVHGYGVISGLSVSVRAPGSHISLSPGMAIDAIGREICVLTPVEFTLPSTKSRWQVSVHYVEAEARPMPSLSADTSEAGTTQSSRIEEGVEVVLTPIGTTRRSGRRPIALATETGTPGVPLAVLHRKDSRWMVRLSSRSTRSTHTRKKQKPEVE